MSLSRKREERPDEILTIDMGPTQKEYQAGVGSMTRLMARLSASRAAISCLRAAASSPTVLAVYAAARS